MDWHCLGHAMWLAEVDGLRLLFDPLLEDAHYGGVFEVHPPRRVHAAALRADFVFVSHRHPDHFDLASLRRLAALDPDTVVVTSDELVAACARRVGFRGVRIVAPETRIDLDGPRVVTSPSRGASEPEWGVVVANADGVVYDQIDTAIGTPADVRAFFRRVAEALGRDADGLVTLALARWQPLLEVDAMLAGAVGFPFRAYADELERCAALGARAVCPAAAGARHAGPHAFMNRLVYPVTEARFVEDATARMPGTRVLRHVTGATYRVAGGDVSVDEAGAIDAGLVSVSAALPDPRAFRPLDIPPIVDPNLAARPEDELRGRAAAWVAESLVPALERAAEGRRLRYVLEIVLPRTVDVFTLTTGAATTLSRDDHLEWDVRCAVAGSLLVDVIEARRHWGELLLGGMLRAATRAHEVDERGLRPVVLQPLFVYEALSYEESVLRALDGA
ncbi:MAG: MBL fold metallo-hydrolase [Labilithrix sp.]|nr:MBL fold metallo-hydrolase [Labilithrix sp.]